jgi:hypothetical protein
MPGTVEAAVRLVICNISAEGALVRSGTPLAAGSEHHVTVRWEAEDVPATMRVRHVRPDMATAPGVYLIGLEFVAPSPELQRQIARCMTSGAAGDPA